MASKTGRPPQAGSGARVASVVACWMCGTRLDSGEMVPDGGAWCHDVRWYCLDTVACTQRWTAARPVLPASAGNTQQTSTNTGPVPDGLLEHVDAVSTGAGPAG